MSAMKVFSAALRFLKEDALKTIKKEMALDLLDFIWVLTVPDIWDIPARQFMREAACHESLVSESSEKVVLVLEGEVTLITYKQLNSDNFMMSEASVKINLCPGTQFIVVDCGENTIDITVLEVLEGGQLKELNRASGHDKGRMTVERMFTQCMRRFFCDGLWEKYEEDHPKEAQEFMEDFIFYKLSDPTHERPLHFYTAFKNLVAQKTSRGEELFNPMDGLTFHWTKQPNTEMYSAKLEISERRMESFFQETLVHVTENLQYIMNNTFVIKHILLVGDLSSSHILRKHVQKQFGDQAKVMCPKNPQEVSLRGALLFGEEQSVIKSRKSAFTYGVGIVERFDPSKHKPEKMFKDELGDWCNDIFFKLVEIDEDVDWNMTREYIFNPASRYSTVMSLTFYRTERTRLTYVDEWGVDPVAHCLVDWPAITKGLDRQIKLEIFFGSSEMRAKATDVETKLTVTVNMDFITKH